MSIPLTMNAFNEKSLKNINSLENINLKKLCFEDFQNNNHFGFGSKRLAVNIKGTITEKFPFRAFGYRDKNLNEYIGIRRYYDQGDRIKIIRYNPHYLIINHIIQLVQMYETENNNKNNLNIQSI
jgi:hypothetical protein